MSDIIPQQKTGFGGFVDNMPPWAKGVAIVGSLALAGWLTVRIYSDVKDRKKQKKANEDGQQAQDDLAVLAQNGIQPTYVQSTYAGMADTLVDALNGCNINTDSIKSVMHKMKNTADVLSLVTAFGARGIKPCWANPYSLSCGTVGWLGYTFGSNKGTVVSLPQALQKISEGSKYDPLTTGGFVEEVNGILKANNVNYQF